MNKDRIQEFIELEAAAAPLRAYLVKYYNPNAQVVVRMDRATVMCEELSIAIDVTETYDKSKKYDRQKVTRRGITFQGQWYIPIKIMALLFGKMVEVDSKGNVYYEGALFYQLDTGEKFASDFISYEDDLFKYDCTFEKLKEAIDRIRAKENSI